MWHSGPRWSNLVETSPRRSCFLQVVAAFLPFSPADPDKKNISYHLQDSLATATPIKYQLFILGITFISVRPCLSGTFSSIDILNLL